MGKDYTATGAKKWLITVGGFVLFVIIVVGIFLMIPANTKGMTETLASSTENFFIVKDESEEKYDNFATKITSASELSFYSSELNFTKILNQNIYDVEYFYNNYMIFAKKNNTLSSNYKTIQSNISKAQKYKNKFIKTINETLSLEDVGLTVLHEKMIVFRENFYNYINCYQKAFVALSKCYDKCFEDSFSKNNASKYILQATNDYLSSIVEDFNLVVENDKSGMINQATYQFNNQMINRIIFLDNFVSTYIPEYASTEIQNYIYDNSIQEKYSKIERFFEVYNEKDFKAIVASIDSAGVITKTYSGVEDTEGLYSTVKSFLKV